MAQQYDNTNTFTLNKNDKGDNPKRPDYRGKLNVDGIEFTLSGWIRESVNGKFISGSVQMAEERAKPVVESAELSESSKAWVKDYDADIPF